MLIKELQGSVAHVEMEKEIWENLEEKVTEKSIWINTHNMLKMQ